MAPERMFRNANIRAHKLNVIDVKSFPPFVSYSYHVPGLVRGNQGSIWEAFQVLEEQRCGDRMPQQELQHLLLRNQGLRQHAVARHQESCVCPNFVPHHVEQGDESEVVRTLHLPLRDNNVFPRLRGLVVDGRGWR